MSGEQNTDNDAIKKDFALIISSLSSEVLILSTLHLADIILGHPRKFLIHLILIDNN